MLLLDLPRGEMESEEETATGGTSSVFVWRGGAEGGVGMLIFNQGLTISHHLIRGFRPFFLSLRVSVIIIG